MGMGVPAFACKLWAPPHCPQCCCLGVGTCHDLPASWGAVPVGRVVPGEAMTMTMSLSHPPCCQKDHY